MKLFESVNKLIKATKKDESDFQSFTEVLYHHKTFSKIKRRN